MNVLIADKKRKRTSVKIPNYLIYEVRKGKPIYYKGYKSVLNKTKTFKEITTESLLQSWLKAQIAAILIHHLTDKNFQVTAGELGINLSKEDKRGADIAIFENKNFILSDNFSNLSPEIVIEIDVKANMEDETEFDYVLEKIGDYHRFGVKKVIWVFTKTNKIMEAPANQPWVMRDWTASVNVIENLQLNIADIMSRFKV
jgi:Uma2 family endonuclease